MRSVHIKVKDAQELKTQGRGYLRFFFKIKGRSMVFEQDSKVGSFVFYCILFLILQGGGGPGGGVWEGDLMS
jgi:hypothetical protein